MWVFFLAKKKKKVRVCLVYKCTCCRYIVFIVFLIFNKSEIPFSCAYTCTNSNTVTIQLPLCRRFTILYNAGMDVFFVFNSDKIWFKLCFKYINICIRHLNKG